MPPPPPPPGPPPPPVCNLEPVQLNKKEADGRNLLLSSIRQGTKLKKATTNDRSGPLIDGKNKPSSNGSGDFSRANGAPPGLGGLFAGGMPKLKSARSNFEGNQGALLPPNKKTVAPSPPVSRASFNNGSSSQLTTSLQSSSIPVSVPQTSINRSFPNDRGPAPQPPPAANKPNFSGINASTLPRPRTGPPLPSKPPVQGNKPVLGPRPPPGTKPAPPAKNLANSSHLAPAHPSNLRRPSSLGEHDFRHNKFVIGGISSAGSVPKLNGSPATTPTGGQPPIRNLTTPSNLNLLQHQKLPAPPPPLPSNPPVIGAQRTTAPAPPERMLPAGKPPNFRPPAPPTRPPVATSLPHPPVPTAAPPPPPHQGHALNVNISAPPPPPQRTASAAQTRVVNSTSSNVPPPPPTRHASVRNASYIPFKQPDDFESRFVGKFKSINELPPPESFKNIPKTYPTKQERQNAMNSQRRQPPPPPPQPQLQFSSNFYGRQETHC